MTAHTPDGQTVIPQLSGPVERIGGEASHRAQAHARNAVNEALEQRERQRQAPRLRAQAQAAEAASRTFEALGAHDPLLGTSHPPMARLVEERKRIAESVQATFNAMSQAMSNPQFDGPQTVMRLAEMGQDALAKHLQAIDGLRDSVRVTAAAVEGRVQTAMQPPSHIARLVEQARDALRGMPENEQYSVAANARGTAAEILMYAVGGAPGFLSGLAEAKHMQMRETLLAVRDPELLELEPGVPQALAALDKAEAGIRRLMDSVVDFKAADDLRALGRV